MLGGSRETPSEDTPSAQMRHGCSDGRTITRKKLCTEHLKFHKVDGPSGPCNSAALTSSPNAKFVPAPSGCAYPVACLSNKNERRKCSCEK